MDYLEIHNTRQLFYSVEDILLMMINLLHLLFQKIQHQHQIFLVVLEYRDKETFFFNKANTHIVLFLILVSMNTQFLMKNK